MDVNKTSSNRSFGLVFFIVFLIVALFPLLNHTEIYLWSLVISLIFLFLGLLNSSILTPLNTLWLRFGLLLGKFISPLIMGIIYFVVVFPTFLVLKIFKKNYLNIRYDNKIKTYWINIDNQHNSMEDQF